jgi:hypothetical protein
LHVTSLFQRQWWSKSTDAYYRLVLVLHVAADGLYLAATLLDIPLQFLHARLQLGYLRQVLLTAFALGEALG